MIHGPYDIGPSHPRLDALAKACGAERFSTSYAASFEHIATLTATTAAKERIESELRIAHDIQMSILPKIFPPFPDRPELDVFASILPAREVGGDL